jgi:hypothetical protein
MPADVIFILFGVIPFVLAVGQTHRLLGRFRASAANNDL